MSSLPAEHTDGIDWINIYIWYLILTHFDLGTHGIFNFEL